ILPMPPRRFVRLPRLSVTTASQVPEADEPNWRPTVSYANSFAIDHFAADAAADARASFIRRTYLHLFGAILLFIGILGVFLTVEPINAALYNLVGHNWWIALIAFMAVSWIANWWASSGANPLLQYAGLGMFIVAEAVIFVPIMTIASLTNGSIIPTAGFLTLLIFGG